MESIFKARSYGYYGLQYLKLARGCVERAELEQAVLHYQHSIECSLKQVLAYSHCIDKSLMQSHKVLRLASSVFASVSDPERYVLRVLGVAYYQLRYPVDDEIEDELLSLGDPENKIITIADKIAEKSLQAAYEAHNEIRSGMHKLTEIKLD